MFQYNISVKKMEHVDSRITDWKRKEYNGEKKIVLQK